MIELDGIERDFLVGDEVVHALNEVSLDLPAGDYVSVMGPSGSGKSTLLNVLGLLDRPNSGSYRLDGVETTEQPEEERAALRRERIGFVFQAFHLIPRLSAADNIGLPMLLAGIEPRQRAARVDEVLASLDLTDRGHHRPDQLSDAFAPVERGVDRRRHDPLQTLFLHRHLRHDIPEQVVDAGDDDLHDFAAVAEMPVEGGA